MSEHPPELVEKVARAMFMARYVVGDHDTFNRDLWERTSEGMREDYRQDARAALDAITEPHAVVELPEPQPGWWDCYEEDGDDPDHIAYSDQRAEFFVTTWNDHPGEIQISHQGEPLEPIRPAEARALAAALLAAVRHTQGTEAPD